MRSPDPEYFPDKIGRVLFSICGAVLMVVGGYSMVSTLVSDINPIGSLIGLLILGLGYSFLYTNTKT